MENSHHVAKTAYQRHTQHSGGKYKKSPLVQTYQHWYRIIAHRFWNKELVSNLTKVNTSCTEDAIAKRCEASLRSATTAHAELWRSKCRREGSR